VVLPGTPPRSAQTATGVPPIDPTRLAPPRGIEHIINWEPHNRADAIDVAIGSKADIAWCTAHVRY
jgi:hypothetical protein